MSDLQPFRPNAAATLRLSAVTVAGTAVRLAGAPSGSGCQVRVRNRGTVEVFIQFGKADVVAAIPGASGGSAGIAPGAVEYWTIQQSEHFVALAVESGTPSVEITTGVGG
ncbi:hypothetical protein ASF41_22065 [Methylobacterium sp. Leaf111]|uniref:hypothetical protein n=1 Tax=Methylobacterium sp. Leaf111 TaxID=1736257 RepID=UPI0006F9EB3D|nr:hypothetical protein [Methylobacterium sp. Leaf111]KQP64046.1 hypothetical protein ASF41_22065 [Methylobacterium sp. Leaf111]